MSYNKYIFYILRNFKVNKHSICVYNIFNRVLRTFFFWKSSSMAKDKVKFNICFRISEIGTSYADNIQKINKFLRCKPKLSRIKGVALKLLNDKLELNIGLLND